MAANAQISVEPYSGAENQMFRQFEHLFRGFQITAAQMETTTQRCNLFPNQFSRNEQLPATPYASRSNYASQNYRNFYRETT